jgi:hypothetical protein
MTVKLTVVVPEDLLRSARAAAAVRGDDLSEVVCRALQDYIGESTQEAEDVRIARAIREIRERIARGEEPTYLHDEIWAEIGDLLPRKSSGNT